MFEVFKSANGLEMMVPQVCSPRSPCLQYLFPRLKGAVNGQFSSKLLKMRMLVQPVLLAVASSFALMGETLPPARRD